MTDIIRELKAEDLEKTLNRLEEMRGEALAIYRSLASRLEPGRDRKNRNINRIREKVEELIKANDTLRRAIRSVLRADEAGLIKCLKELNKAEIRLLKADRALNQELRRLARKEGAKNGQGS